MGRGGRVGTACLKPTRHRHPGAAQADAAPAPRTDDDSRPSLDRRTCFACHVPLTVAAGWIQPTPATGRPGAAGAEAAGRPKPGSAPEPGMRGAVGSATTTAPHVPALADAASGCRQGSRSAPGSKPAFVRPLRGRDAGAPGRGESWCADGPPCPLGHRPLGRPSQVCFRPPPGDTIPPALHSSGLPAACQWRPLLHSVGAVGLGC